MRFNAAVALKRHDPFDMDLVNRSRGLADRCSEHGARSERMAGPQRRAAPAAQGSGARKQNDPYGCVAPTRSGMRPNRLRGSPYEPHEVRAGWFQKRSAGAPALGSASSALRPSRAWPRIFRSKAEPCRATQAPQPAAHVRGDCFESSLRNTAAGFDMTHL